MRRFLSILVIVICSIVLCHEAMAFWIWTPKTKKLVNPKYAPKDTPEKQFKWAMKFFEEKDYKRSAEEFARLTIHFKESELAPEAQYYAGLSYEKAGKPYPAFLAYQKTIDLYPFTKRIDEVIEKEYNLGNELYKKHEGVLMGKEIMTDLDRAAEIFTKVRENAPFGEYADQAQFMVGECYKKSEQYGEATKTFQKLVEEYPRSKLVEKARYEVAQCTYLATLKPDYDQELTDEAIKEFKKIAEREKGLALSEDAKKAIALLEKRKAESLFNTAKFYERQKHYKSAAIYYKEILKQYPKTSFGEEALERLKDIDKFLEKENQG